jgi:hypothetical protein
MATMINPINRVAEKDVTPAGCLDTSWLPAAPAGFWPDWQGNRSTVPQKGHSP